MSRSVSIGARRVALRFVGWTMSENASSSSLSSSMGASQVPGMTESTGPSRPQLWQELCGKEHPGGAPEEGATVSL
ncbi:hypothetical protein IG631_01609 [Alternaria alternata]|nr:hypothetical protein IG631_01609 [Alternaria alternata]